MAAMKAVCLLSGLAILLIASQVSANNEAVAVAERSARDGDEPAVNWHHLPSVETSSSTELARTFGEGKKSHKKSDDSWKKKKSLFGSDSGKQQPGWFSDLLEDMDKQVEDLRKEEGLYGPVGVHAREHTDDVDQHSASSYHPEGMTRSDPEEDEPQHQPKEEAYREYERPLIALDHDYPGREYPKGPQHAHEDLGKEYPEEYPREYPGEHHGEKYPDAHGDHRAGEYPEEYPGSGQHQHMGYRDEPDSYKDAGHDSHEDMQYGPYDHPHEQPHPERTAEVCVQEVARSGCQYFGTAGAKDAYGDAPHFTQHRSELACCQREGDDSWVHYSSADTGRSQPGSAAATKGLDGPHDYSPSDDNSDCLWTAVYHKPVDLTDFKKQIGTATAVCHFSQSMEEECGGGPLCDGLVITVQADIFTTFALSHEPTGHSKLDGSCQTFFGEPHPRDPEPYYSESPKGPGPDHYQQLELISGEPSTQPRGSGHPDLVIKVNPPAEQPRGPSSTHAGSAHPGHMIKALPAPADQPNQPRDQPSTPSNPTKQPGLQQTGPGPQPTPAKSAPQPGMKSHMGSSAPTFGSGPVQGPRTLPPGPNGAQNRQGPAPAAMQMPFGQKPAAPVGQMPFSSKQDRNPPAAQPTPAGSRLNQPGLIGQPGTAAADPPRNEGLNNFWNTPPAPKAAGQPSLNSNQNFPGTQNSGIFGSGAPQNHQTGIGFGGSSMLGSGTPQNRQTGIGFGGSSMLGSGAPQNRQTGIGFGGGSMLGSGAPQNRQTGIGFGGGSLFGAGGGSSGQAGGMIVPGYAASQQNPAMPGLSFGQPPAGQQATGGLLSQSFFSQPTTAHKAAQPKPMGGLGFGMQIGSTLNTAAGSIRAHTQQRGRNLLEAAGGEPIAGPVAARAGSPASNIADPTQPSVPKDAMQAAQQLASQEDAHRQDQPSYGVQEKEPVYGGWATVMSGFITSVKSLKKEIDFKGGKIEHVSSFNGKPLSVDELEALPEKMPFVKPGSYKIVFTENGPGGMYQS